MKILGKVHDITISEEEFNQVKIKIRTVGKDEKVISKIEFFVNKDGIIKEI